MSTIPNWEQYVVKQKRPASGCIPTGYEVLLRAANVKGINFETFQDDFDLDKNLVPDQKNHNNFSSVADMISKKYPHVNFKIENKERGDEKLKVIASCLKNQNLILVSLYLKPIYGINACHIMPVVDMSEKSLSLVSRVITDGIIDILVISNDQFVSIHDNNENGRDIAYLDLDNM